MHESDPLTLRVGLSGFNIIISYVESIQNFRAIRGLYNNEMQITGEKDGLEFNQHHFTILLLASISISESTTVLLSSENGPNIKISKSISTSVGSILCLCQCAFLAL